MLLEQDIMNLFSLFITFLCILRSNSVLVKIKYKNGSVERMNITGPELGPWNINDEEDYAEDKHAEITEIEFLEYYDGESQIRKISDFPNITKIKIEELDQLIGVSFLNLPKLTFIGMDNNEINYVHAEMFGKVNVKELELGHNYISRIDDWSFSSKLSIIDLSCNDLTSVKATWFQDPGHVTDLSFDGNKLTVLESKLFHNFTNLVKFSVNLNKIHTIGEQVFPPRKSFIWISLGYNQLEQVLPGMFAPGNITMKYLEIQFNKLTYLPKELMMKIHGLELTNIDGNPWSCPCYLNEIVPWINWEYYGDKDWEWPEDVPGELRCLVVESVRNNLCVEKVHSELIRYYERQARPHPTNRKKYCECTKNDSDKECIYFF